VHREAQRWVTATPRPPSAQPEGELPEKGPLASRCPSKSSSPRNDIIRTVPPYADRTPSRGWRDSDLQVARARGGKSR
jgi:hypothetical protein